MIRRALLALFAALLWPAAAGAQMMQSPIWTDADTVVVRCFVEPDPALATPAFEAALCGRMVVLLRARLSGFKVVAFDPATLGQPLPPTAILALVHGRVQRAETVLPGAAGLLVSLAGRLTRTPSPLHPEAWFGAAPTTALLPAPDRIGDIEPMLSRLVAELVARS